jgi:hypothetical protein
MDLGLDVILPLNMFLSLMLMVAILYLKVFDMKIFILLTSHLVRQSFRFWKLKSFQKHD